MGRYFAHVSRPHWCAHTLLYNGYLVSFQGVKQPGRSFDHPLPHPTCWPALKKEQSYTFTLSLFLGPRSLLQSKMYLCFCMKTQYKNKSDSNITHRSLRNSEYLLLWRTRLQVYVGCPGRLSEIFMFFLTASHFMPVQFLILYNHRFLLHPSPFILNRCVILTAERDEKETKNENVKK